MNALNVFFFFLNPSQPSIKKKNIILFLFVFVGKAS